MSEVMQASLAGGSAILASFNAVLATDGAQICTDAEGEGAVGAVGAFQEVFAKVTQQVEEMPQPVAELPQGEAPKLPELLMIPPLIEEDVKPDMELEELREEVGEDAIDAPSLPMPVGPVIVESPPEVEAVERQDLPRLAAIEEGKIELPAEMELVEDREVASLPVMEEPKAEFSLAQGQGVAREIDAPVKLSPPVLAERGFVEENHPKIVSEIRGRLLPDGGSMHIRLDPPELGALAVQIDVRDGMVSASFQTSNDEATRLLSHSLGQLRQTLEGQGVSVEKLQVQQTPREQFASNSDSRERERGPGQQGYERSAQDDQQRREMLARMWRRLAVGRDMLDLVA
jgi:hypothetical protein